MNQELIIVAIDGTEIKLDLETLISLDVILRYNEASQFSLNFAIAANRDAAWPLLDDSPFGLWKKIEISAGFDDSAERLFTGFITHIRPGFGSKPNECSLQISGYDETLLLNREEKIKVWRDTSDSRIASEIFSSYGLISEIEDTEIVHNEAVSSIVQRETDMQFLKRLANRNGFECYVINSKAYFGKSKINETAQPTLSVQFGSQTNVNHFEIDSNGMLPVNAYITQIARSKKQVFEESGNDNNPVLIGAKSYSSIVSNGITPAKLILTHNPTTGQQEMGTLTKSITTNTGWFITGKGEIAGNIYGHILMPWKPVTIKGVGELYSGTYYVTDVTHRFTKKGYYQDFVVVRNSTGLRGDEVF